MPEQMLQNQRDLLTRCDDNLFIGVGSGSASTKKDPKDCP